MNRKEIKWTIKKFIKTVWITAGVSLMVWVWYSFQSKGVDQQLLQDDEFIKVKQNSDYFLFTPTRVYIHVLVFYPGALVDPKAYVPLCRNIANNNIQVYLIKMPWRFASRGYNKPKELQLFTGTSKKYILSGHSQGAKMAAQFVYENPGLVDKLILIGSTHPRDISLAEARIPIMKIYGSRDGIADEPSVLDNKTKLPATTTFVRIEGANHAQFGYYGFQLGDQKATISRMQQQAETLENIISFIKE